MRSELSEKQTLVCTPTGAGPCAHLCAGITQLGDPALAPSGRPEADATLAAVSSEAGLGGCHGCRGGRTPVPGRGRLVRLQAFCGRGASRPVALLT